MYNASNALTAMKGSTIHRDRILKRPLSPSFPRPFSVVHSLPTMPPIRTEMKSIRIRDRVTSFDNLPTTNPSLESLLSELHHFDVSKRLKVGEWRAGGGYADVYEGELKLRKQDDGGQEREHIKVAVKRLRVLMNADSGSTRVC